MYDLITTDFNNLMNSFFNHKFYDKSSDYYLGEDENSYTVSVDIPGIPPENVEINLDGNCLIVSGKSSSEVDSGARNRIFKRVWSLPGEVDLESINAEIKHGVLTLTLPKTEASTIKSIPVKTS